MNSLNKIMKQAQQMQATLLASQNKMANIEIVGASGGGMVSVTINGKSEIKKLDIDRQLMSPDEVEIVCDLIIAAFNDAKSKLDVKISEEMGGLFPPDMKPL